jgi:cellulose biosynthesis protein BcsQ
MTEVALSVSTHILSPVRPDRFAKYGLTLLERLLEKIDGDFDKVQKLVIMNGVERSGPDAIETTMRKELSEFPFSNQRLMQSRIPVSKRLMARPAKPGVRDLTLELAYHSALGSSPIQKDLQSAAVELATELGI